MSSEFEDVTGEQQLVRSALAGFVASAVAFFTGSAILAAFGGTPPSETPLASISAHFLWFVGVASLAVGTLALVKDVDSLTDGLGGYLAVGALGLGVLLGLQWTTWAYVDTLASTHDQYDVFLDTVISPFGAGLALMYGFLVGSGVAQLGWSLRRTQLIHGVVAWAGVAVGLLLVAATTGVLLVGTKAVLFGGTILLFPLPYLWAAAMALDIYRRNPAIVDASEGPMRSQKQSN